MPLLFHRTALAAASLLSLMGLAQGQGAQAGSGSASAVRREWDGAVTLVANYGPEYLGGKDSGTSARPGFFVRYGRISLSSGGGFAARKQEVELRGLGIELARDDNIDITLSLRNDSGRNESDSEALRGMGDVKRTLRARIAGTWRFAPAWTVKGAWTVDAFGRGGGNVGEIRLQHEWRLTPRLVLTSGSALTIGGDSYMQAYFGVTPEQSARSGYPVYAADFGARDIAVYSGIRAELGEHWVLIGGPGYTRLLGPAARSPLVRERGAFTFSAGVGYRF